MEDGVSSSQLFSCNHEADTRIALHGSKSRANVVVLSKDTTGFDLTFQKSFVSFPKENNPKSDLKCRPLWLGDKKIFSLQIAQNGLKRHFLNLFFLLMKNIRLASYTRRPL